MRISVCSVGQQWPVNREAIYMISEGSVLRSVYRQDSH